MIKSNLKARRTLAAIAVGTALMLSAPSVMAASKINGSLSGQVSVQSGTSLENVQVKVKHESKGLVRSTISDDKGNFNLKALPIGKYTISFTKDGFETIMERQIEVKAGTKGAFNVSMFSDNDIERISVTGNSVQMVDFESSTTQLVMTSDDLAKLPIGQNLTSIALLAPSSSLAADADADYGRGASFNGSSVAENGYFLNGLNITDIRKGLGNIDLPWEAIAQTNIVTGGVSAEYGQFIGGVTDIVTKSGDNDFKFGVMVDYIPGSLSSQAPDTWGYNTAKDDNDEYQFDRQVKLNNQEDLFDETRYNIYASGAIIEDTLFFYGIFNPQKSTQEFADTGTTFTKRENTADYWLAKVDWYINDDHSLGFTALNNERKRSTYTSTTYNYDTGAHGTMSTTPVKRETGGSVWSINYSGIITDDITISGLYGKTEQTEGSVNATPELSQVKDFRNGLEGDALGDWTGLYASNSQKDTRTQMRLDLDWEIADHTVRFGYSQEVVETADNIAYSGPKNEFYEYFTMTPGRIDTLNTERAALGQEPISLVAGDDYVRTDKYGRIGAAESINTAFYIQDTWNVTDEVTLNLGLRNSSFESKTGEGETYAKMDNQWAPRLGAIWDINGDGVTKVSVNYGRYYMPISPNTSVRMTLGETNHNDYMMFDGMDSNFVPLNTESMWNDVSGDGTFTQPPETLVSGDLDPMYSDEISVAVSHQLTDDWLVGVRFVYQDLISSIEDTNMKYVLNKWSTENPAEAAKLDPNWDTSSGWVGLVMNPGQPVLLRYDENQDGVVGKDEGVTWSADYIGLPQAERTYQALELTLEGKPTENSTLQASYVYSRSEGNTEGLVSGVHSQADPGWSGSFDSPEVVDHSYGNTSNDIPHKFKVFGGYDFTDNLNAGFVFFAQEGRARNVLGYHPRGDAGVDSCAPEKNITNCGDWWRDNFYTNGEPSPRGSAGHGSWITQLDLSINYSITMGENMGDIMLSAKVFNVLDSSIAATYEDMSEFDWTVGNMDPNYGNATSYQAPRTFLFTARYDF